MIIPTFYLVSMLWKFSRFLCNLLFLCAGSSGCSYPASARYYILQLNLIAHAIGVSESVNHLIFEKKVRYF
jgi:hypothetical protein